MKHCTQIFCFLEMLLFLLNISYVFCDQSLVTYSPHTLSRMQHMASRERTHTLAPHPTRPGPYSYCPRPSSCPRANLGTAFRFRHFLTRLHSWLLLAVLSEPLAYHICFLKGVTYRFQSTKQLCFMRSSLNLDSSSLSTSQHMPLPRQVDLEL